MTEQPPADQPPAAQPTTGATRGSGPRRTFGPVVLVGLASGTVVAVAGTRAAVSVEADGRSEAMVMAGTGDALTMPLVTSLALVALAAWGVLLVTRGRVRRGTAALALLASAGALAAAVVARASLRGTVDEALTQVGATGSSQVTGWYVAALVGALVMTSSAAMAVRWVPAWPEMGRRYDAPATGDAGTPSTDDDPGTPLDLWKAMDEGRDPTDPDAP